MGSLYQKPGFSKKPGALRFSKYNSEMVIRPYTLDDFEAVTCLWRAARELAFPDFQRAKGHTFEDDRAYFGDLLDHAKRLSPEHAWLYTFQVNTNGRAFYEKNGFVAMRFGVSPAPESEPDVEYHWRPGENER